MSKCKSCGTMLIASNKFCPECGAPVEKEYNNYESRGNYEGGFDPRDIEDNKVLCMLCYLGIFLFIPLLMRPYSPYTKYHANQGIALLLLEVAITILRHVYIPFFGWMVTAALSVFSAVCIVIGILNTLNGRAAELPIIGQFRLLKY